MSEFYAALRSAMHKQVALSLRASAKIRADLAALKGQTK